MHQFSAYPETMLLNSCLKRKCRSVHSKICLRRSICALMTFGPSVRIVSVAKLSAKVITCYRERLLEQLSLNVTYLYLMPSICERLRTPLPPISTFRCCISA